MPQQPHEFGRELRRRRLAANISLEQLGVLVHYSKGQLSKVERGLKPATSTLARLCDEQLKADGALAALAPVETAEARKKHSIHDGEVWLMQLGQDGSNAFHPVNRRSLLSAGAASLLTFNSVNVNISVDTGTATLLEASRSLFREFRRMGQTTAPGTLLPSLIAQTHSLQQMAAHNGARTRSDLLTLASRYAEYAGWMAQESGNDEAALWWTGKAVELAAAGGDHDLATYGLARRALISLLRGDSAEAVELAGRALESDVSPRVRGLAAQKLAQAHAVAGDYDACMRSLDRARELLAKDSSDSVQPIIGASHLPDVVSMFTGWCLQELGRPEQAAETLEVQTAHLPDHALRSRSRYGVRQALAHATAGDIDQACSVARSLLGSVALVHSATITADLHRLARTLRRHPGVSAVRELDPELSALLAASSV